MSDLYEDDIVTWSEHQSELLRRVAAGEAPNEVPDWVNIAEEIESVGSERLHSVQSWLRQALIHMLKAEAWPASRDVPTWRADAIMFRTDAAQRFVESMRTKIDLERLYRQAKRALPETMDGQDPLPLPEVCPVTLDELLSEEP
jgi:hypothetical protein